MVKDIKEGDFLIVAGGYERMPLRFVVTGRLSRGERTLTFFGKYIFVNSDGGYYLSSESTIHKNDVIRKITDEALIIQIRLLLA